MRHATSDGPVVLVGLTGPVLAVNGSSRRGMAGQRAGVRTGRGTPGWLGVGVPVGGRRCGVQGIQFRFAVWGVEEQGAEHGLADAVDLSWRGVVVEAYPCP